MTRRLAVANVAADEVTAKALDERPVEGRLADLPDTLQAWALMESGHDYERIEVVGPREVRVWNSAEQKARRRVTRPW